MTVILECIAEQHRRNCKQAERGQAIHKILGESSIIRPKVKLAFTITVLTMKYRRERESLPVTRTGLVRSVRIRHFDSIVSLKTALESNSPDNFFDDNS
jgi:hypothetical protein